jgi:hypothetical protein
MCRKAQTLPQKWGTLFVAHRGDWMLQVLDFVAAAFGGVFLLSIFRRPSGTAVPAKPGAGLGRGTMGRASYLGSSHGHHFPTDLRKAGFLPNTICSPTES